MKLYSLFIVVWTILDLSLWSNADDSGTGGDDDIIYVLEDDVNK